ncbi:GvpL/GvpF family gas vesicle protein [Streptomyces sp. NRRL S-1448]|uniref:GvpL/GvpF family gas vesicle protein n=1 Tax=Streptomyces sp. NRRL S-1448 TaxID=1463883 RepID=UPI00055C865F|nr:GvpL/GvpF family gas vesicle protein [Streptomyces sp. NRRL S-1448]
MNGAWHSYVYAVGRDGGDLDAVAAELAGLHGAPLRTVAEDGLTALVSSVPADDFGTDGLTERMADLTELEALARAHHEVVEAAHARTTVLPMRLATVYLDDTRVSAMLSERAPEFGELLTWLDGHAELGVKVYADPVSAQVEAAPATPSAGSGRAYLRRRRDQRRLRDDTYRAAGAVAGAVRDTVAPLTRGVVAHRPQQGELAAGPGENIANEAYLVPRTRVREFHQALAGLTGSDAGVRVEITGPWAPYSFATRPAESGAA